MSAKVRRTSEQVPQRPASATTALVIVIIVLAVAVGLRTYGVQQGAVYGSRPTDSLTYLVAGLAALAWALWRWPVGRDSNSSGELASVLAVVVALVPALNLAFPSATHGATVAACENSRLYGADFRAVTLEESYGANARSGPGYSHDPVGRFPAGCLLGFVGYCIGEPVREVVSDRVNTRWLLLPRPVGKYRHPLAKVISGEPDEPRRFVSDAIVLAQDPDSKLKQLSRKDCVGGQPSPGRAVLAKPVAAPDADGVLAYQLTVTARRAHELGLAVWVGPHSRGAEFRPIDVDRSLSTARLSATWRSAGTAASLKSEDRKVIVAGVPCLGGDVPADVENAALRVYVLASDGSLSTTGEKPQDVAGGSWESVRERLASTACALTS